MPAKTKTLVLDTWAIIAFYEGEPAGVRVSQLIAEANDRDIPLWMSVVNAGEVWYVIARRTSEAEADATISELLSLGIHLDDLEWKASRQAALFKSKHKLSYADAFAAALALEKNGQLVTGDREFKQLENEIKILWIRGE